MGNNMDGHKRPTRTEWFQPRYAGYSASAVNSPVLPTKFEGDHMKFNNNAVVPEAREALDKFKMEAASDLILKNNICLKIWPINRIIMIYIPFIFSKIHI